MIFRMALVLIPVSASLILFFHIRKQQADLQWGKVDDYTGLVEQKVEFNSIRRSGSRGSRSRTIYVVLSGKTSRSLKEFSLALESDRNLNSRTTQRRSHSCQLKL